MTTNTGLALCVSLLFQGCVSGTPYQRALRLQSGEAAADEIVHALSDPSWKIRCLAARACGASGADCLPELQRLVLSDPDESVRTCSLEGLAARCEEAGRATLGNLWWEPGAAPGTMFLSAFADAVESCPSADASLLLSNSREVAFLEGLAKLSEPRGRTRAALADARGRALRVARQEAALAAQKEEQRLADEARRARLLEEAVGALARRDVGAAASNLDQAEDLGADVSVLRSQIEEVRVVMAAQHLDRAWEFVRKDKPTEAEQELQQARVLGGEDQRLDQAISNTPSARRRRADEERAERKRVSDEEKARKEPLAAQAELIGTDWDAATSAARRRGANCRSKITAGREILVCGLDLDLDFVSTTSLRLENRPGTGVSVVHLEGYSDEVVGRCREIMERTRASLKQSGFAVEQLRAEAGGWALAGELARDRDVTAACNPATGFWIHFADAWLRLPAGRTSVLGRQVAGEVVLTALLDARAAVVVARGRPDPGEVVDLVVTPRLKEQFSVARASAGRISARSRAEFESHVTTVTSRQWLLRNYLGLE